MVCKKRNYVKEIYSIKSLFKTQKIKLINKKQFVAAALDANSEIFVLHIFALNIRIPNIYPF